MAATPGLAIARAIASLYNIISCWQRFYLWAETSPIDQIVAYFNVFDHFLQHKYSDVPKEMSI